MALINLESMLWPVGLLRGQKKTKVRAKKVTPSPARVAYLNYKTEARTFITPLVTAIATHHNFHFKRIAIKDTKRSWGSCSALGNLNFSYKLLFLPPCIARYIVVHELCHLRHLHHRQPFWDEVGTIMPDYGARLRALRSVEKTTGTSRPSLSRWLTIHDREPCAWCLADAEHAVLASTASNPIIPAL